MRYEVFVRDDYRWPMVQSAGRRFYKESIEEPAVLTEAEMDDQIRNHPDLEVVEIKPPKPPKKKADEPEADEPKADGGEEG